MVLTLCVGCSDTSSTAPPETQETTQTEAENLDQEQPEETSTSNNDAESAKPESSTPPAAQTSFDVSSIPAFSGSPYVAINNNVPYFSQGQLPPQLA